MEAYERYANRKRAAFVADYAIGGDPALVWQVWPADTVRIDTNDKQVIGSLFEGSQKATEEAFWRGFKGSLAARVFEGVASHRKEDARGVATEIHEDGHFVAGLWTFPGRGEPTGVGEFYEHAFIDALEVAVAVLKSGGYAGEALATCTFQHADRTVLWRTEGQVIGVKPKREQFRWPVVRVSPGECERVGIAMAKQFLGVYGRKLAP